MIDQEQNHMKAIVSSIQLAESQKVKVDQVMIAAYIEDYVRIRVKKGASCQNH